MISKRHGSIVPRALTGLLVAWCWPTLAAEVIVPSSLVPCPYTQEEIKSALGLDVEAGITSDMEGAGSRDVGCVYPVKKSFLAFAVRQTWDPNGTSAPSNSPAQGVRRIAGDADGAAWLPAAKEDKPHVKMTYHRNKVRTTLDVYGSYFKEEDMSPKLEKLRRVP